MTSGLGYQPGYPGPGAAALGPVRSACRRAWGLGVAIGLTMCVGSIPLVLMGMDAPANLPEGRIVAWAIAGVWVLLGALVLRRAVKDRRRFVAVHEGGLAVRDRGGLRFIPWREIERIVERPRWDHWITWLVPHPLRIAVQGSLKYTVQVANGRPVVFSEWGFSGAAEVGGMLMRSFAARRPLPIAPAIDGGAPAPRDHTTAARFLLALAAVGATGGLMWMKARNEPPPVTQEATPAMKPSKDIRYQVELSGQEACDGKEIQLSVPGRPEVYTVRIPKGVVTGTELRLRGQGEAGDDGSPAGDLYLVIGVD